MYDNVLILSIAIILISIVPASGLAATPQKPVLVIGATGKVGRLAVQALSKSGVPTRAMCRDVDRGREVLHDYMKETPDLITLVKGDVTDPETLKEAIMGTQAVLALHGTLHPAPIHKLLIPIFWATHSPLKLGAASTHPYFTNYVAMQDILTLCEKYEVGKIVRLTGLSCAFPPYNPVSVLFNALLSFSGRYHRMGEEVLQSSSKVQVRKGREERSDVSMGPPRVYSNTNPDARRFAPPVLRSSRPQSFILRPGGLSDEPRDSTKTTVQLDFRGNLPPPARVGRGDVANAAVLSVIDERLSNSGHIVAAIRWAGEVAPKSQGNLGDGGITVNDALGMALDKGGGCNEKRWAGNSFAIFHGLYVYAFTAVAIKITWGFAKFALRLVVKG